MTQAIAALLSVFFLCANSATAEMPPITIDHTATLLPDGKVLVIGGYDLMRGTIASTAVRIYDPVHNSWEVKNSAPHGRRKHMATLLPNGKVVVMGGLSELDAPVAEIDVYDYQTDTWEKKSSIYDPFDQATLLQNGKILLTSFDNRKVIFYDYSLDKSISLEIITSDSYPVDGVTQTLPLPSGEVLLVGTQTYETSYIYSRAFVGKLSADQSRFTQIPSLPNRDVHVQRSRGCDALRCTSYETRYDIQDIALLPDNKVLFLTAMPDDLTNDDPKNYCSYLSQSFVYDLNKGKWKLVSEDTNFCFKQSYARRVHALGNGKIMFFKYNRIGIEAAGDSQLVFTPAQKKWSLIQDHLDPEMPVLDPGYSVTALNDGTAFYLGVHLSQKNGAIDGRPVQLNFDPEKNAWKDLGQ